MVSRGGQGLPERRAPAGEPVSGTEVRSLSGPTRGKGEPASTRRQASEGGSGRPGEGPPSQARAEASNKMLWPLDSTRYPTNAIKEATSRIIPYYLRFLLAAFSSASISGKAAAAM